MRLIWGMRDPASKHTHEGGKAGGELSAIVLVHCMQDPRLDSKTRKGTRERMRVGEGHGGGGGGLK